MPSSEPSFSAFRERLLSETVKERLLSETDDVADLGAPAGLGSRANSFIVRTKENSTFRPLTAGGVRQSILVLVQTSLGGGILTMGYMMKLAGLANGLLFLLLAAFVAAASMEVLMKSAVMLHRYTLGSLLGYVFGRKSGVLLDMMLFIYGNGTLILYFVFLGDFIPNIFQAVMGGADSPPAEQEKLRTYCVVAAMCTVMPVSLFRDLSMLRVLSPVMVIGIVYTELVVLIKCFTSERSHVEIREVEWSFFPNLQAFSLCVFGYVCHMNVTPVAKELESPSDRRIEKVTFRVVVVQFIIYTLLAATSPSARELCQTSCRTIRLTTGQCSEAA
ncbi:unnamed protein product [Effrenium voratum]|uniref:Amino acid transporter transmembrane domain-containing protein n=1 Tax=Effrenium voratum TaxID=2562239 RepID=A0AA36JH41_9DINO|nr:unnamed protein product [Effrenium voratum]